MVSPPVQNEVDDLKVQGWSVHEEQGSDRVVMINRKTGTLTAHLVLFIVAGWWTIGAANLAYLGYKYFLDADKRVVRADEE